jgi:hypothetical protein
VQRLLRIVFAVFLAAAPAGCGDIAALFGGKPAAAPPIPDPALLGQDEKTREAPPPKRAREQPAERKTAAKPAAAPGQSGTESDKTGETGAPKTAEDEAAADEEEDVAVVAPIRGRDLVGLDRAQTVNVLGPPNAERTEATATVWSYWSENCTLEIVFYPTIKGRALRSLQYLVRDRLTGEPAEEEKCLLEMMERKRRAQ